MLTLNNWNKSFKDNHVLKNINLTVGTGDVLTIIGSSGSGKSTLLRSINFLEPRPQKEISWLSEDKQPWSFKTMPYSLKRQLKKTSWKR